MTRWPGLNPFPGSRHVTENAVLGTAMRSSHLSREMPVSARNLLFLQQGKVQVSIVSSDWEYSDISRQAGFLRFWFFECLVLGLGAWQRTSSSLSSILFERVQALGVGACFPLRRGISKILSRRWFWYHFLNNFDQYLFQPNHCFEIQRTVS